MCTIALWKGRLPVSTLSFLCSVFLIFIIPPTIHAFSSDMINIRNYSKRFTRSSTSNIIPSTSLAFASTNSSDFFSTKKIGASSHCKSSKFAYRAYSTPTVAHIDGNNYHNNIKSFKTTRLFSSSGDSTAATTTVNVNESDDNDNVISRGELVNIMPSKSGVLVSIKVSDDTTPEQLKEEEQRAAAESSKPLEMGKINMGSTGQKQSGDDLVGNIVTFGENHGIDGIVIAQRYPVVFVYSNEVDLADKISSGPISVLSRKAKIGAKTSDMMGATLDYLGNVIAEVGQEADGTITNNEDKRSIFSPIPKISEIALINTPLLTGNLMVDALAPIGKGQNMLIIGDAESGKRDVAIDIALNQVRSDNKFGARCIYACTSPSKKERQEVLSELESLSLKEKITFVSMKSETDIDASNDVQIDPAIAAEAVVVAASACAIAEDLALTNGDDCVVIVDAIDLHNILWEATTRSLIDLYGADSVVADDLSGGASSEKRAFYSSLIQRAGRFNAKKGGGSVTLILLTSIDQNQTTFGVSGEKTPGDKVFTLSDFDDCSEKVKARIKILDKGGVQLTAENLGKINIPPPITTAAEQKRILGLQHMDDLISMSDGQIWLSEELYKSGQRPALDVQRSLTRVGVGADTPSRADAPAIKELAGGLRFELAQAASLSGADENSGADRQIRTRDALLLAMHQERETRLLSEECICLLAARIGTLDAAIVDGSLAGTDKGSQVIKALIKHVKNVVPDALNSIDETLDLTEVNRNDLEDAIKSFSIS